MALYFVTGALGSGKGLYCNMIATQAYRAGRRVAANYPINTYKMDKKSDKPITIIPPRFTYDDLMALGRGCEEKDLSQLGVLILDEAAISLNARNFKDNGRQKILDFFVQSRKYGWDVYIQAQEAFMVDKQLVDGAGEFVVKLSRLDNLRIPFITSFLELVFPKEFGRSAKRKSLLPHIVKYHVYLLKSGGKPIEKGSFRAKDFFGLHDTNYIFENDETNDHVRDLYHCDFISQEDINIQAEQERIKQQYAKPFKRLMSLLKFIGFIGFFYGLYLMWTPFIFADKSPSPTTSISNSISNVEHGNNSSNSDITHLTPDKPTTLSEQYRIIGYLSTGMPFSRFILKDTQTGQVIYLMSNYAYLGLNTSIVYDNQLVTYFSGVSHYQESNDKNASLFQLR